MLDLPHQIHRGDRWLRAAENWPRFYSRRCSAAAFDGCGASFRLFSLMLGRPGRTGGWVEVGGLATRLERGPRMLFEA